MSKDGSGNLLGPSLTLDIDCILNELDDKERVQEQKQVTFVLIRNISALRKIYGFYSALGHDRMRDGSSVMTKFQFWRFLKDCQIHHRSISLSVVDRMLFSAKENSTADIHNPMEKIVLRDFLSYCVILSFKIFCKEEKSDTKKSGLLSRCLQRLVDDHIIKHAGKVKSHFLFEPRRAINALAYMERSWRIYQAACTVRRQTPHDSSFYMRQFLFLLKDLKIVGPELSTKDVVRILSADDPTVSDGENCNLELEMTFLEFFEALIGIAINFNATDSRYHHQELQQSKNDVGKRHLQNTQSTTGEKTKKEAVEQTSNRVRFKEEDFNDWCSKLHKFFTQRFFPAWNHAESLRNEIAKTKARKLTNQEEEDSKEQIKPTHAMLQSPSIFSSDDGNSIRTTTTSYESSYTESEYETIASTTTGMSRAASSVGSALTSVGKSGEND